jgi:hypothetical protein
MILRANIIHDIVVPVIAASKHADGYKFESLLGTGFFIGKSGFGITASHVIEQYQTHHSMHELGLLFQDNGKFIFEKITNTELHTEEDVGVFQIAKARHISFIQISNSSENASCEFHMWSYPDEVSELAKKELVKNATGEVIGQSGEARPEMIFFAGYIRRRMSREHFLHIYKGNQFYEISEIGGACCSGSPIVLKTSLGKNDWQTIGIYIGENKEGLASRAGYVTRFDSVSSWKPVLLAGKSILDESKDNSK